MTDDIDNARCVRTSRNVKEKTERAQNARFATATTCSFGINPRSSLRLAFWRDSPEPSHRDFSSLSDPPALTAPHCVVTEQAGG